MILTDVKRQSSFEQGKIISIDRLKGRVSVSLRNGLVSAASYLYDVKDLREGMSVLVGKVSNTHIIIDKAANVPRSGRSFSLPRPAVEPAVEEGLYYSFNGEDWILMTALPTGLKGFSPGISIQRIDPEKSMAYADDFKYNSPASFNIWDDNFTGNDGDPPNEIKWYSSLSVIRNNSLQSEESGAVNTLSKSVLTELCDFQFKSYIETTDGDSDTFVLMSLMKKNQTRLYFGHLFASYRMTRTIMCISGPPVIVDIDINQTVVYIRVVAGMTEPTTTWQSGISYEGHTSWVFYKGVMYGCLVTHISSALSEPEVGVDWETYWRLGRTDV